MSCKETLTQGPSLGLQIPFILQGLAEILRPPQCEALLIAISPTLQGLHHPIHQT